MRPAGTYEETLGIMQIILIADSGVMDQVLEILSLPCMEAVTNEAHIRKDGAGTIPVHV